MPDWAFNKLTITLKDIKQKDNYLKLLNNLKWGTSKVGLDFNTYISYPKKFEDMDKNSLKNSICKNGYSSGGYEWCAKNWGTKWNASEFEIIKDNSEFGQIIFGFYTAWVTPLPIIEKMSKTHKGIEFKIEATNKDGIYKRKYINGIYHGR